MIEQPAYAVDPWAIRESELHLDTLAQSESMRLMESMIPAMVPPIRLVGPGGAG